jgi:hypothetical protein
MTNKEHLRKNKRKRKRERDKKERERYIESVRET